MVDDQLPDEHLFTISFLSPWFADIENYLVSAQFPPNFFSKEKSIIIRKSSLFTWIGGNLFKLRPDQILRRCVREEEVFDILLACHDGPCRDHFATKRTAFKVLQVGYYWPTLHQDVKMYTSQCDWCQRMGNLTPRDEIPLQPQVTFKPFDKWGMDFIRPIDRPSKQNKKSTPYHPQANGKVEVTNLALEGILAKVISSSRKDWADILEEATWAYNTTWETTTAFTPYELAYGKKALLSIEFEYNTLRMAAQLDLDVTKAQQERLLQLNGLDEFRMQAPLHTEVTQVQRKIWNDRNIKDKLFQEGN
eukprot:PITA_02349